MSARSLWSVLVALVLVVGSTAQGAVAFSDTSAARSSTAIDAAATAATQQSAQQPSGYIVVMKDAPLALYGGGISGLAPTSPETLGQAKLDVSSAASQAYLAHLASQRADLVSRMATALGRTVSVGLTYQYAIAGFSTSLTPSEAARVRALPGVAFVQVDKMLELLTDNGPEWMGAAAVWSGSGGTTATKGEGIVVGIIDTGVNNDHPSFADIGGDGYDHANPRGHHYGVCAPVNPVLCNDKLIGMWDFTGTTPFDDNGHGSHTASTVAGNVILGARLVAPTTTVVRDISGVAPHANIISYKACIAVGCLESGTVGSIDQATADRVDVVNFSIGGSSANPWENALGLAFLGARTGGVFIAASAGNSGPNPATMGQPANSPWTLAVGASTHDRRPTGRVHAAKDNGAGVSFTGMTVARGIGERALVDANAIGNLLCNPFSAAQAAQIAGKIVVCEQGVIGRVAKGQNVLNAGGAGMILVTQRGGSNSVVADTHVLPTVMISANDGKALRQWLTGAINARASLDGVSMDEGTSLADRMAYFSSRGPDPSVPDVIKPDVTAPGVAIFAAWMTAGTLPANTAPEYNIIQGTSMSSPHAAGAAALVRAANRSWTPAQVHSAMVTTAFQSPNGGKETVPVTKEDHTTPADAFDMGGGRVDVAGAARAGLTLNEGAAGYLGANPAAGGDPKTINMPSLGNQDCQSTCTWTRTVTSTKSTAQTWTAAGTAPAGVSLSVSPATFTLAPGASQTITVTASVAAGVAFNVWQHGQVTLTSSDPSTPAAHLPVALRKKAQVEQTCVIPPTLIGTDAADQAAPQLDIRSAHIAGLFPTLQGVRTPSIEFRIKVQDLSTLLPNVGYKVYFTTPTGTIMWVGMNTWDQVGVKFEYGTNPPGSFTTIGVADEGSYTPDGNIRIVMAANKLGYPEVGEQFTAVNGQVRLLFGAGSTGLISGAADSTTISSYTFRACAEGPVAFDDTAVTEPGRSVTIDVLANDKHTDNGSFSLDSVTQPANGSAVANANGTVTYTPNSGFRGTDTFTYTIKDAQGRTSTGNVRVAVEPSSCAIAETVVTTDGAEANVAPQHDIREIAMAGLFPTFNGQATPVLKVRLKVATLNPLPPDSHWRVAFAPPGAPANTTYYVQMIRGESGDPRFVYGTITSGTTSSFSELGEADAGSWSPDGNIRWTIATAKILSPRAGDRLEIVQGTTGVAVPGQLTLNNDSTTVNAATRTPAYTLGDCANVGPVANADQATTTAGTPVTIDVLANDSHSTGEPLTITAVTAPANGTATKNADATITYTPNNGFSGVDTFSYTVTDPQGRQASAAVSVTVAPFCPTTSRSFDFEAGADGWAVETAVNDGAPVSNHWQRSVDALAKSPRHSFTSDDPNATKDDRLVGPAVSLSAFSRVSFWHRYGFESGFDGGVLEVSTDGGSSWLDVTDPLVGGRFLSGGYTGSISTTDGSAIAGRQAWTGGDGSVATGTMAETVLEIGSLGGKTAQFRWRLVTDALIPGQGWWIDDVTFSGLATDCNEPPVANGDSAITQEDRAVTVAVLANDTDPDGDTLTVGRASDPANGTATVNADGTITYTPNPGFVGTDTFTYTAFDGEYEDTATVTVTVEERPNTAPIANDDQATTPRNTPTMIAVLANDLDDDGDALTITGFTQPSSGRVTGNGDGTLTYTPAINFSGTVSFEYTVGDGHGGSDTATVTVRVGEPGAPLACFKHSPKTPEADTNASFDARCSNDDDTPRDQLTFEWDFQDDGVVDATGSQTKHRFGTAGTYTVTLRVRDAAGHTDVLKKAVEVIPAAQ